ncbi:MAG TPA: SDR family oxidoreductase [Stellaceae bacterium]|jgi:3-oxoacyl-[acyl-carrier protein] reductase|nr:SDR family oxidoreductase [Stellaceae bacterium]
MITADLRGKAALVTGGASGIGLATAELLLLAGAKVAMNHLGDDGRAATEIARFRAHGYPVVAAPGDVSRPGEAESMVTRAIDELGGLDILVNNAGTPGTTAPIDFRDLDAMTEAFWQTILATNLLGPYRCSHAAAAALKAARGAIVNTASVAGLGRPGSSIAYGASKAGLVNLTRSLAVALAPEVRVNAVAPGLVDSPWTAAWPAERKRGYVESAMMKRMCTPADIAEAIFFLAAGGAMITGHTLPVDGGLI